MPRGIKGSGKSRTPATERGQPRRRGRKPKELLPQDMRPAESKLVEEPTGSPPAQTPELAALETALERKYPQQKIKPGSLLPSGATAEFGKKRSLIILCRDCGDERRIATSDLFQVSRCRPCTVTAKRAAKKGARPEKTRQYSLTAVWRQPDKGSDYWHCSLTDSEVATVKESIHWLRDRAGSAYGKSLPRWTLKTIDFQAEEPLVGLDAVLAVLVEVSRYGQAEYGGECPALEAHLQSGKKEGK